jgi:hypothetical protein
MEVERGPLVNLTSDQRAEFRKTGELPTPKTEDAAPSPEAEPKAETVPASEAEKTQQEKPAKAEKPKQTAEDRIAQLEATIEKIRKGAGLKEAQKVEPPATKVEQVEQQFTRPKPTPEDKNPDGTPKFSVYEDYIEDLADWKSEQREAKRDKEQAQQAQTRELNAKVESARSRYENFDDVLQPTVDAIVGDAAISPVVKHMLNDSEVLPDLIFTIGSSEKELASFVKMAKENPGKALRYIALTESLIAEELEGKAKPTSEAKPEPPAKPQTAAPKPPSEVGGRAASPGDALESAAKANDFRAFKAEANRRAIAKLKS